MATQNRDRKKELEVLQKLIAQLHAEDTSVGRLNLLTASGITRKEQVHSNLIAHLIKGDQAHGHPEYGVAFIRMIYEKLLKRPFVEPQWLTVETEKGIWVKESKRPRRLDIYIESEQFILVIENKTGPFDEDAQLRDYYLWLKREAKNQNKEYLLAYLTPYGDKPNPNSLTKKEKNAALDALAKEVESKLILLSYADHILPWLKSLKVSDTEASLEFSKQQYIEALEVLCEIRREDMMDFKTVANTLQEEAKKHPLTAKELHSYKALSKELENGYAALLYIRFLEELCEALKKQILSQYADSIFLTHCQVLYDSERRELWLKAIKEDWENMGIAVQLKENISVGLEIDTFAYGEPNLYFGIMLHGKEQASPPRLEKIKGYTILPPESPYWGDHIRLTPLLVKLYNDPQVAAFRDVMPLFKEQLK